MAECLKLLPDAVNSESIGAHTYRVWSRSRYRLLVCDLPWERAARHARTAVREVLRSAGVDEADVGDAELAVGELAANAVSYAEGPYEIRFVIADGLPIWCEVIDGNQELAGIPNLFARLRDSSAVNADSDELPQEHGHGLGIVHQLSDGRCDAYPTVTCTSGHPGKAVAFALPGTASP